MDHQTLGWMIVIFLVVVFLASKKRSRTIPARSKRVAWAKFILDQERTQSRNAKRLRMKDYEFDHIRPFSKGGTHDPHNIRVIPQKENRSKRAKMRSFWD